VDESEFETIIEKAGISSLEAALNATKKLLKEGDAYFNAKQFAKAIQCFDQATTMPSLLPA